MSPATGVASASPPTPAPHLRRRPVSAPIAYGALGLLALIPLVPLLLLGRIPLVDGPAHVLDAFVLTHYGQPGYGALSRAYVLSAAPSPNVLTELALAAALRVVSPDLAEHLAGVAIVMLFALGATYAVRSISRERTWLVALAAPFATGYIFFLGFYNFCLATGLALGTLGLFLRRRRRRSTGSTVALAVLLLLVASAHLMPFVMVALVITIVTLLDAAAELAAGSLVRALRVAVVPIAALVPPSVLSLVFLARSADVRQGGHGSSASSPPSASLPWTWSVHNIARVTVGQLAAYSYSELVVGAALLVALVLLVVVALARVRRGTAGPRERAVVVLAAMALLSLVLLVAVPDAIGTLGYIKIRFALFTVLFTVLALAGVPTSARTARVGTAVGVASVLVLTLVRLPAERVVDAQLREYSSVAGVMRPGSTFVTLRAWAPGTPVATEIDATAHAADRVAVTTRSVDLNHLDGRYDYFPAHFRDLDTLGVRDADLVVPAEWVSFLSQSARSCQDPDYVLVWGRSRATEKLRTDPDAADALEVLRDRYTRRWVSSPDHLMELYRRNSDTRCPNPS